VPPPPPAPPAPSADPPRVEAPVASASATASAATAEPPPRAEAPLPPFPPPPFKPPHERTAKPGDGEWTPYVPGPSGEPALFYKSVIHPDPIKGHIYVALVAIDLRRVAVRLVAGTQEPLSTTVPETHRPGVIPAADLPKLVAVMNGGFMTRHGKLGMMVDGEVFLPPQPDACTFALMKDGSVRIRTYTEIAGATGEMIAYRQTPPCLVEQRNVHPALLGDEKPRRWGMSETGGLDIRRSAVGIAEGGRTLYYASGEWITPRTLAEAMRSAGAVDAAELDVNYSYTKFLLYAPGDPPQVKDTLIPKTKFGARTYVQKPAERDFFYLKRTDAR
jgi:hypothetical protein